MNNFFNFKEFGNQILVTNDFGRYLFLSKEDFKQVVAQKTDFDSKMGMVLKENLFAFESSKEAFSEKAIYHYRRAKNYIFSATALHIFVVTDTCNMNCCYCQAQNDSKNIPKMMNKDIAKRAADIALSSPQKDITVEFQGGEPLLNFDTIKFIVSYIEANKCDKNVEFSIVSNLTLLTDEIIDFIKNHNISVSTSIDGPEFTHDSNRPYVNGLGTYQKVIDSVKQLKKYDIQVGAIQTTTQKSLKYSNEIIDSYIKLGFNNIFIRPLTPLGFAKRNWHSIGYTADEFVEFYEKCIDYIISLNLRGIMIRENHAGIFLSKILKGFSSNYMELRSPCGASTGQLAYYYDGNVFTCDEGRMMHEMGDTSFKLGNVFENNYDDLMDSPVCKAVCSSSILESLPKCCDCVYQSYCGVCPVVNYAMNQDLISRGNQNYRCKIYSGMLDKLFRVLQKNNKAEVDVLKRWSL